MDNEGEGTDKTAALRDMAVMETLTIDMKIMIEGEVKVKEKVSLRIIEEEVKIIFLEGDEDNGMVTTRVTVKETMGTEIMMAKIMGTEVGDGMAVEGKVIVIGDGEEDGTQIPNILNKSTHNNTLIRIIIGPLAWVVNTNIRCPMSNTQSTHNRNNITHRDHPCNHASSEYMSAVSKSRPL